MKWNQNTLLPCSTAFSMINIKAEMQHIVMNYAASVWEWKGQCSDWSNTPRMHLRNLTAFPRITNQKDWIAEHDCTCVLYRHYKWPDWPCNNLITICRPYFWKLKLAKLPLGVKSLVQDLTWGVHVDNVHVRRAVIVGALPVLVCRHYQKTCFNLIFWISFNN